ncbi:MAG TPA: hypothetical protein VGL61_06530 [Kofleriaceae bacterium]|jgi:hypothetical protein
MNAAILQPESLEASLVPTDRDARARYLAERNAKLARAALDGRRRAFATAARSGDLAEAERIFMAERGAQERVAMIRAQRGDETTELIRRAPAALREALLAAHPNRMAVERELVPAEQHARFVFVRRAPLGPRRDAELAMVTETRRCEVDQETAFALKRAGCKSVTKIVGDQTRDYQRGAEYRYEGWQASEAMLRERPGNLGGRVEDDEPEPAFLARLTVDRELVRYIADGKLEVTTRDALGRVVPHAPEIAALVRETT